MTDQWNPNFFQVIIVSEEKKGTEVHISTWLKNNEYSFKKLATTTKT